MVMVQHEIYNEQEELIYLKTPSKEENFLNGKLHGITKEWWPNGKLWYEGNFQNGLKHGVCKTWNEDGTLYFEGNFINGNQI